jgi:hypothetical protein
MRQMTIALTAGLAACGGAAGGTPTCAFDSLDLCFEYPEHPDPGAVRRSCNQGEGDYAGEPSCDVSGALARCVIDEGGEMHFVAYYYAPTWDLTDAEADCATTEDTLGVSSAFEALDGA